MTDQNKSLPRRNFLGGLCTLSALGLFYLTGGCEKLLEKARSRPVRRDIARLTPGDPILQAYRHAVAVMKSLPSGDPRNWRRMAQIYRTQSPRCNWYFLPWHRAWLASFEKICRQISGYQPFALPYWNWNLYPAIPAAFWGDPSNSLFNSTRLAAPPDTADSSLTGSAMMQNILSQTNYLVFGGSPANTLRESHTAGLLESAPHNGVLRFAGGDMASFMAPLDPLFWSHQAAIDRCWVEWNLNRHHENPSDQPWVNFSFQDFMDENGSPVKVTVQETVLFPIFNYAYEDPLSGKAIPQPASRAAIRALEAFARRGAPAQWNFSRRFELQTQVAMEIGGPANRNIRIDPLPVSNALESGKSRLLLTVEDVVLPRPGDFFLRVFVNKPDASALTSIDEPNYAGSLAFLMDEPREGAPHQSASLLVDITDTLRRLNESGSLADPQRAGIQLVAVPFPKRTPQPQKLSIERVELKVLPAE